MTVPGREQNWDNWMVRFTSKIEKREDWRQRHTGVSLPDFVWGEGAAEHRLYVWRRINMATEIIAGIKS